MKKTLLLIFGALIALPCAHIIGQDIDIPKAGTYRYVDSIPIPPEPPDSIPPSANIDNAVKGTQGYQHNYAGQWSEGTNANWYERTLTYTANGSVTFKFNGTAIEWYTETGPTHGIAAVSIDGGAEEMIDLYSPTFIQQVKRLTKATTQEVHTIKIRATGTKNASSSNVYVLTDYFKVINQGLVPDVPVPPDPEAPEADVIVNPGQSIKAVVEQAAKGTTVGLLQGTYNENLFNVPVGVSLVGAGKDKTIINFTGSMPQQSETGMIQLKGGTTAVAASTWTAGGIGIALLIALWLLLHFRPWEIRIIKIVAGVIVVIVIIIIIYVITRPTATTTGVNGDQTISGFTINGKFQCNGGIIVDGRDNVKIVDVKVQETTYFGAWLKNTNNSEFANNELVNGSWASVGWVTGELCVFNITNTIVHHNLIRTTRTDKGYGIKALWPEGTITTSKFYSNRFQLVRTSMWNNGSAPNIDIEFHDTFYAGIEIYDNDFSTMGLSLASAHPTKSGRTIVRNNRFTWSSTAAIEVVCSNLTIEANTFAGSPMLTANFAANGKYTDIIVNNNDFNSDGSNPGWGALHLIGPDGMNMTITNNRYNNTRGYQLVKHMGNPGNSVIVQSGNVLK